MLLSIVVDGFFFPGLIRYELMLANAIYAHHSFLSLSLVNKSPCGGKTSAMEKIASHLKSLGIAVFVVPEAATFLHLGGLQYDPSFTEAQLVAMETALVHVQQRSDLLPNFCDTHDNRLVRRSG
jgi:hypothetical protein